MRVHQVAVGSMQNFTYVVEGGAGGGESIVIDPSWDLDRVRAVVERGGLPVKYIVNTHHHFDHTTGNGALAGALGARVVQHELSGMERDLSVAGGDRIEFGGESLEVLHTPGHSRDSICLLGGGNLFSGDTLFVGSCGRVDLPGGSAGELYDSLFDALYGLDDGLTVFPGHDYGPSPTSTLGAEKRTNPVLQRRGREEFVRMMAAG